MERDDRGAPRHAPGVSTAHWMSCAALCVVSLVLYVAGASGDTGGWADLLAFAALPVLWPAALPLRGRQAVQAAMMLASGVGLMALGSAARALWGGRVEVPDGPLIFVGAAVLVVGAARRCLGEGEAPAGVSPSRILESSLLHRLLKEVQMQGGARGVMGPYVAAPREPTNAPPAAAEAAGGGVGPFSAAR